MDEFARERRIFTPIDEIPDPIKQAFISAEDKNFYSHAGFDPMGIAAAIYQASQGDRLRGASTITQQVMKNFLLTGDRSGERKIKEIILATRLEATLTKDKILELYLNEIFLGQNSYGVTAAAQVYFAKSLEELTPRRGRLSRRAAAGAERAAPGAREAAGDRPAQLRAAADGRQRLRHPRRVRGGAGRGPRHGPERRDRLGAAADAAARLLHRRDPPPAVGEPRRRGAVHRRPDHPGDRRSRTCSRWRRGRCATGWRSSTASAGSIAARPAGSSRPGSIPTNETVWRRALAETQVPRDIEGWRPAVILSIGDDAGADRRRGRARGRGRAFPQLRRRELGAAARRRALSRGAGPRRHVERRRRRPREGDRDRRGPALVLPPGARDPGRLHGDGHPDRPRARHAGRVLLPVERVQPRHPGAAPAGLVVQALRLRRGARQRLFPGDHRGRRADRGAVGRRDLAARRTRTRSSTGRRRCAPASSSRAT